MWVSRTLVLAALLAPAVSVAGRPSADYARQVDAVQMRLAELEGLYTDVEGTLRRLEEGQRAISSAPSATSGGTADGEVARELRGQMEVLQFEIRSVRTAMDTLATDLDTRALWQEARVAQLERALGLTPPPIPTGDTVESGPGPQGPAVEGTPQPAPGPTQVVVGGPANPDDLMDLAEEHMRSGRQRAARAVLQRVMDEFPESERVAEALYRRAETWFNDGEWGTAASEFQTVIDRFPRDDLAAWSMLRQGEAFERLGELDSATLFWDGLIRKYPNSDAAEEARALLGG